MIPAFGALLVLSTSAWGAPVEASFALVPLPGCNVPLPPAVCILAYDRGSSAGPGDDVAEASVVVARVSTEAFVPGAPSAGLVLDYQQTYVSNPVFPAVEDLFRDLNGSLPASVTPYVSFRTGTAYSPTQSYEGFWIRIDACSALPVAHGPCAVNPGVFYGDGLERDRIYPLADGGTGRPFTTDETIQDSTRLFEDCLPEETALVPGACAPQAWAMRAARSGLEGSLPNVVLHSGVQRIAGGINLPGSSRAAAWERAGSLAGSGGTGLRGIEPAPLATTPGKEAIPARDEPAAARVAQPGQAGVASATASLVPLDGARAGLSPWLAVGAAFLAAVALYRRLHRDRLLEQPTRRAVMEVVRAQPGVTPAGVAKRLGVSYKTAMHHADLLVQDGLLTVRRVGRERRLFPATKEFDQATRERHVVLQKPGVRRLLRCLPPDQAVPRRGIAEAAGLGRTAAWSSLRVLHEAGIIAVEGRGASAAVRLIRDAPTTRLPAGEGEPAGTAQP